MVRNRAVHERWSHPAPGLNASTHFAEQMDRPCTQYQFSSTQSHWAVKSVDAPFQIHSRRSELRGCKDH